MSVQVEQAKLVGATIQVYADMLEFMDIGETLSDPVTTVTVLNGVDSDTDAMIDGDPVIAGTVVSQKITGGISGNIYIVAITANSSNGNKYIREIPLAVVQYFSY